MMFEDWQFGRKLSRLHRTRDRIEKSYAKKMHDSFKARSSHDEKERLIIAGKWIWRSATTT
jgi:hypothetical protein